MRAVIQRVKSASVTVEGEVVSEIRKGLLVFLGVAQEDTPADVNYMRGAHKSHYRTRFC